MSNGYAGRGGRWTIPQDASRGRGHAGRGRGRGRDDWGRGDGGRGRGFFDGGRGRGRGGRWSPPPDAGRGSGRGPSTGSAGGPPWGRGGGRTGNAGRSESDVARFLRLLDAQDGSKLAETIRAFETTSWKTCWNDYGRLSEEQLHILLVSLVKLPYSSPVKQPPSASCRRVCDAYVTAMRSSSKTDDETIAGAEILVRFVQRLLKFHWDEDRCAVKEELGVILCAASSLLRINRPEHRVAQSKITELLDELEKPWIVLLGTGARDDAPEAVLPSTRPTWELATVDWLLNPRLFQPSCLPVMKTPDTPSAGVYPSRDDYIKTIERLWTAMTFGDGNGALSSKCLEPECNQVLWPCHHGAPGATTCRTRECQRPVVLVCSHRHHNRGLCSTCAARSQTGLIGPPGVKASTHVYDAQVFHVGTDGRIFLGNVMSRRPPAQAIHWRTTNRLSCPNLVGFVKVSGRGVPLRGPDRITWASIVPHEDSRFEDKRREAGELAVLCSGILNVNVHELVHIGDHLVVVDCQIFVPEFIPVLKALELQKAITLPFDDGTWLNLSPHAPATSTLAFLDDDDDVLLDRMLAMSTLDPIVQIRRDFHARAQLHTRLVELMRELTLDPGQRRSFLEALTHPVHLTQGPPGTGKSYLGVGLARALLIVRNLWIQQCPSVGQPPILVLSYKNHAIDEFLKDLVRTQPSLKYGTGGLVRIGGACKDPELAPFSEQSVFSSRKEVVAQKKHLEQLHQLRGDVRHFCDDISPLVNFQYNLLNDATKESTAAAVYVQTLLLHLDMHTFTGDAVFDEPSWHTMFDALKTSTMQPMAGDHIEGLMRGIAHYHNQFQTTEVLWKWMTGFVPLPKCCFCSGDTTCDRVAWSRELVLCEGHVCSMDDCADAVADEGRSYCRQHACTLGDCDRPKLPGQVLCEGHACFICLASCPSELAHPAEDAPPRNVCSRHPLCCASMCINEVLESSDYCAAHQKTTCRGKTKKGYACKAKVNSPDLPYCVAHRSQATRTAPPTVTPIEEAATTPALDDHSDVDETMYTSCSAKTRKGKPCKAVFSQQKIPFCVDHKSQYVPKPMAIAPPRVAQDAQPIVPGTVLPPAIESAAKPSSPVLLAAASPSEQSTKPSDHETSDSEGSNDDDMELLDEPCDKAALDNEDEVEESEHLQHLREVFDDVVYTRGDVDGSEASEALDANVSGAATAAAEYDEAAVVPPRDWSWAMSLDERRRQLMLLESRHRGILAAWLGSLAKSVEHARHMLHDAEVKAKARVYEGKAVIGGTIVGCISRLESIRATNPFAIIVEEASEVLEPLLFVCLGDSTCKLEMIGDHLQLKPSVQSKFNFERINKIGVSMFERLIRAPANQAVPSSVLAIQRRMRQNICDLTREFYTDIVAIEDHATCATRTLPTSPLLQCLPTHGREVPGVLPHVFFWTHEGRQQKASVGLSKINTHEADMVVALAKYLVTCGVEPPSIAILTPYKGQLMLMREKLIKAKLLHRVATTTADTVLLSTVDRFQGDEADVVLISLVIDAKSRTPFVKLVNRMVVLLSRARIGMYIVGNAGYFETTDNQAVAHWQATLTKLRGPAANDSGGDTATVWFDGSRLGPQLPICCPLHPDERIVLATRPDQLQLGFCNVVCNAALPCSHVCGKTCHWPVLTHNTTCAVRVPSPCHRHTTALVCAQIYASLSSRRAPGSIDQALTLYKCRVSVDVLLPCSHTVSMACVEETEISEGYRSWPECNKPSVAPFIYKACKHTLACTCADYVRLTANPTLAKKCMDTVDYVPACGHGVSIRCYVRQQYAAAPHAFICSKKLTVALPRCGHLVTVPCNVAASLADWSGESCSAGVVHEGEAYGPKDYACHEPVTFVKACGHTQKVACEVAFDLAKQSNACNVTDEFMNPVCGHTVRGPCHMKRSAMAVSRYQPAVATIDEGDVSQFEPCATFQQLQCKVPVLYRRRCQHQCTISCSAAQAQKNVPKCSVAVVVPNVLCGHDVTVPCGDTAFRGYKPWPAAAAAPLVAGVLVDTVPPPAPLPTTSAQSSWANCPHMVTFERSSSCGHSSDMRCGAAFKLLGKTLPPCSHDAVVQLPCSHERQVQCFEVDGPHAPCTEEVLRECWNYAACRQRVVSLCSETDVVASCTRRTTWQCPNKVHSIEIAQCAEGIPSDCPRCSMDALDSELAQTEELVARCSRRKHDVSLQDAVGDAMASMPPALLTHLTPYAVLPLALRQFLERKLELLHGYKAVVEQMPEWQQPIYAPRTQLYYVVLSKAQAKTVEAVDAKSFVKQDTLYGICLQEWTAANVQWLKEKTTLLLCVGFSCRTLDPTTCVPKPEKKKVAWYDEQRALGADAIQVVAKKLECTIFWDPYTVMTTHKMCLTKRDVSALQMYASPLIDRHVQLVRRIERRMPGGHGAVALDEKPRAWMDNSVLATTRLAGFQFPSHWDGTTLILASTPRSVQLELAKKLQFLPRAAPMAGASPFAGIRYLRTLQESMDLPELSLLHALELLHLPAETTTLTELEAYMRYVQDAQVDAHPLLFLAMGRWTKDVSYLRLFASTYPNARDAWLTADETRALAPAAQTATSLPSDPSIVQLWKELAAAEHLSSAAMDDLLGMIGIGKVKRAAIQLFQSALARKKMPLAMQKKNPLSFNFCFVGNAGTGKTTVARSFAKLLHESGLRSKDVFVETNAQTLKDEGAPEFRKLAASAMDGVLFIDEAYDLDPSSDFKGRAIVSELLTLSENHRDRLTIILAGYEDDMQAKLFSFNKGLKSRFQLITFDDFDEVELHAVWNMQLEARGWTAPPELATIVSKRLAIAANTKGFGNARAVRKEVEAATMSAMARPAFDGATPMLCLEDVVGDHPLHNPKLERVLGELEGKIGWTSIKKSVDDLVQHCEKNYKRQLAGQAPLPLMLNRLFLGNPGTGKTSCAALYGRILKELHFLSSGDVVLKTASDLIGAHVGESQTKTQECLEMARGKVLVIDEAYNLNDNLYGKQVLDVLVEKIQNTGYDDMAVLLLGYEDKMLAMLRDQNPGLARRFPRDAAFVFHDYTPVELLQLLQYACSQNQIGCSTDAMEAALVELERQKRLAHFGNAGAVNALVQQAMAKASRRDGPVVLSAADFARDDVAARDTNADPLQLLDGLYRMDDIKSRLRSLRNAMQVADAEGSPRPELGHFVFRGSPGTGKTTVARAMATILYQLELLSVDHVEETSGLELTGEFVGQTKKRVTEKLDAANGGVLFIDEAYELGQGSFGQEAMTTLVAAMTDPAYSGLVIVIAGYPADMDRMLDRNVGLKSRFTQFFDFPDWTTADCMAFVRATIARDNYIASEDVLECIEGHLDAVRRLPGWGNGRDVKQLWKAVLNARADRIVGRPADVEKAIEVEDVDTAFTAMIAARTPASLSDARVEVTDVLPMQTQDSMPPPPAVPRMTTSRKQDAPETTKTNDGDASNQNDDGQRDAGVSDADWAELEAEKKAHAAYLARRQQELDAEALRLELAKAAAVQERIRRLCPCPAGFAWFKVAGGWRCAGGSHYVTDAQLTAQFTC